MCTIGVPETIDYTRKRRFKTNKRVADIESSRQRDSVNLYVSVMFMIDRHTMLKVLSPLIFVSTDDMKVASLFTRHATELDQSGYSKTASYSKPVPTNLLCYVFLLLTRYLAYFSGLIT